MNKILSRATLLGDKAVLLYLALAKLVLHFAFNGRYGYFRDEIYYLICGDRLAFGFVDHPPFTPLLARLSRLLFGGSLLGLRVFPALAGAATVLLAGLIVRKLGGGRFAQALTSLSVIVSGVILNFNVMLTNNAFEILFWTLAAYLLILIIKDDRPRLWLGFGAVAGVALQNKSSIAFFVIALGIGLLLSPARKKLWTPWLPAGIGLALLIFLPNVLWQIRHGLPFIELNRNAVLYKNAPLSLAQFLGGQLMEAHPLNFLLILAGLCFLLLAPAMKSFRVFAWAYLVLFAFFLLSGGKTYYIAAIYPVMLAAGVLALERGVQRTRWSWLKPAAVVLLLATGAPLAPFALPVLPVENYIAYSRALGVAPPAVERSKIGVLPQHYADQFGWPELANTVARIYDALPEADKKECGIFTQNYGEASAINFFARGRGLPWAASGHNNYWLWGAGDRSGTVVIVVGGNREAWTDHYTEITEVARHTAEYVMPYENDLPIFVCRGPTRPIPAIWPRVKVYI
jgi:hypothetical protein